jgi:serine/threonine protein kinase
MFKQGIPKFIDFGLSKYIDESNNGQIFTIEVGSPMYMAPELLEESGYYDIKVDVWALGIVFYVMLTG